MTAALCRACRAVIAQTNQPAPPARFVGACDRCGRDLREATRR